MEYTATRPGAYPQIDDELYKVLMVDDEEVVRHGLRYMLDWKALGIRIANENGSNAEALQLLENSRSGAPRTAQIQPVIAALFLCVYNKRKTAAANAMAGKGRSACYREWEWT